MEVENAAGDKPEDSGPKVTGLPPRMMLAQKTGKSVSFELVKEEQDPENKKKTFTVKTVIQGRDFLGEGPNKRIAHHNACEKALKEVFDITYDKTISSTKRINSKKRKMADITFIPLGETGYREWIPGDEETEEKRRILAKREVRTALKRLNELKPGQLRWEVSEEAEKKKTYKATVIIGDSGQSFSGSAKSKKDAKQAAADAALKVLEPSFSDGHIKPKGLGSNSYYDANTKCFVTGNHPRMMLNQRVGHPIEPELVSHVGLSLKGQPEFTFRLTLQGQEFYGTANNKKQGQLLVAQKALENLFMIRYDPALSPALSKKAEIEAN